MVSKLLLLISARKFNNHGDQTGLSLVNIYFEQKTILLQIEKEADFVQCLGY